MSPATSRTFNGYGMGSYVVFIQTPASLSDSDPFEAPTNPASTSPTFLR